MLSSHNPNNNNTITTNSKGLFSNIRRLLQQRLPRLQLLLNTRSRQSATWTGRRQTQCCMRLTITTIISRAKANNNHTHYNNMLCLFNSRLLLTGL